MNKLWGFLSILLLSSSLASATDPSIEEQLRKTYAGSQQLLRHFYDSSTLKFDINGNPANKEKEGPWTLLSGVLIDHVTLKSEKLELRGHRRMLVIDDHAKKFHSIRLDEKFSIEIITQPGPDQATQLAGALARVFVSADDLDSVVPDYWRDYIARFSGKATQGAPCEDPNSKAAEPGSDNPSAGKVSARITEGLKTVDVPPNYLPIAREYRVQGELALSAVIDKNGSIGRVCIKQALGAGLDDEMVAAVRQWKYKPYMLNGQPVDVDTTVRTRFGIR
jgi:TonB family protein